ncbi:MAG: tetratricopeptide repeat protein [Alphaproteobacteria bacterium]|nr:tetratricopeptide repeat protein [Alphaproteobacteria bacterium]
MSNALKIEKLRAKAAELHGAGALGEAEKLYRRILELHHTDRAARAMIGVIRLSQGRAAEALAILDPLVIEAPGDVDIRTQRGLALQDLGRRAEALADFDQALAIKPGNVISLLYRGNLFLESGAFAAALGAYDQLLAAAPGYDEAWFRRGACLWLLDRFDDALASYARALALNPARFSAAFNSGTVLLKLDRYNEAFSAFEKAKMLAPAHPYVLGGIASAILGGADLARWDTCRAQVVSAVRDRSAVIAPLTFLPFCEDGLLRHACSAAFVADRVPAPAAPLWNGERYSHDRIRVAYLSSDFHQHATAELIAGLIERHDRSRFEITAFSFSRDDGSAMRARLVKAFDRFEDVRNLSDVDVARLLRESEFDIAVDLKGHTEGARPGILAHRPCPVQVNYLGYPGTIGAPWLDYILADAVVLPLSEQPFYSERIIHLPHCYQVNDSSRAIADDTPSRAEAGLPPDDFVFCCFNAAWKIAPRIFDIWMRLLGCLPGSVLWLLDDNDSAREHLRAAATARGIDPARLVFAPRVEQAAHLARHRLADLFLDTLPYNAHTTASDALWTGLPLVTCAGTSFDGRVAASMLHTIGLPELVTQSVEAYEALALALARDPARLAALKARLETNRLSSPLFDTDRFRAAIEAAYQAMLLP